MRCRFFLKCAIKNRCSYVSIYETSAYLKSNEVSFGQDAEMLRKITTGFAAAVRVIATENVNAVRSFVRDVSGLLSRSGQVERNARLRGGKKAT